jgi:GTP-binding protein YchF
LKGLETMQLGIIGMPMVGKTTLFELLTESKQHSGQAKSNVGMARIPDERIDFLSHMYHPRKTTYAQMEIVDIPGLVPGAEKGSAVFLESVRRADALLHVVRAFEEESVPSYNNEVNPVNDIETIKYELLLADLDLVEKRIERIKASKKKNDLQEELLLLERLQESLSNEVPLSSMTFTEKEEGLMSGFQFLTLKPILICLNVGETDLAEKDNTKWEKVFSYAEENHDPVVMISASIEREIADLEGEEKALFLEEMGITEPGLVKIARSMYARLNLISFFTVGEDEVRAWTIEKDTAARKAAGKIHSDIERGFIRAEVVEYEHLKQLGSMAAVKEKGLFRLEGKEYIVRDGEIVHFRFNV